MSAEHSLSLDEAASIDLADETPSNLVPVEREEYDL